MHLSARSAALSVALTALPARADLLLELFAEVGAQIHRSESQTHAEFSSNHLDFFATASRERFTLLSEVVFEVGENNEFVSDVERLQVSYLLAEWFRVSAGRFHTAIGYYNDAFHHGSVFQLPVERPLPVRFEDDGGLIPAHFVGVHVDGRVPLGGSFKLRYDVESANARAPTRDAVVNAFDALETKAVNARLRVEAPVASATLVLGGNVLFDHIPQNADHPELDERILGVHGAYVGPRLSVIAELYDIHHEGPTGNGSSTRAGFAQLGYRTFADITPYVVFDFVDYPEGGDPYFIGERSHVIATAGARARPRPGQCPGRRIRIARSVPGQDADVAGRPPGRAGRARDRHAGDRLARGNGLRTLPARAAHLAPPARLRRRDARTAHALLLAGLHRVRAPEPRRSLRGQRVARGYARGERRCLDPCRVAGSPPRAAARWPPG
jgi:hypothetical protein